MKSPPVRIPSRRTKAPVVAAHAVVQDALHKVRFDPCIYGLFDIVDREVSALLKGCAAVGIQGKRVFLRVASPAHRQDILFAKERLLRRINQAAGQKVVLDLGFELEQGPAGGAVSPAAPHARVPSASGKTPW